jgi:transposase
MERAKIAGIDVHKRVLMAVVGDPDERGGKWEKKRFGTTSTDLRQLKEWLERQCVTEVVMESTAQYWRPVWLALEGHMRLHLAQAWSNRAPKGKKSDYKDAERLARRFRAGELTLSFVADAELRQLRECTRRRKQLTGDRVRIQNQIEALLEQMAFKLSIVVSDLLGSSGRRILNALSKGTTDAEQLAGLADARVKCTAEQMRAALTGSSSAIQRRLLGQHLEQLDLVDKQLVELEEIASELLKSEAEVIARLSEVPGIRVLGAQQIVAELGARAVAFDTPEQLSSWIGVCPGREESAEKNTSGRTTKGNPFIRSVLCQITQAAVRTSNSIFQQKFNRLKPRLGYVKALWAVAHHMTVVLWKILHEGVRYIEHGGATTPGAALRKIQRIRKELKALGYSIDIKRLTPQHAAALTA